jgi:glutamate synthase (NADPH/NADH) small chain
VVGSGPAGLTVAGDLILKGHEVTIFEALHKPGGVLIYGIPEFRLPKDIVQAEVNYMEKLGVKVECNSVIGRIETVDELLQEYDAVFLALGAGLPQFLNIPGENLCGIYSANEYLTRSNLMKAYLFRNMIPHRPGKNVAVFEPAMWRWIQQGRPFDWEQIRFESSTADRGKMPARIEEVHHAEEEGVQFYLLTAPRDSSEMIMDG